MEIPESLNHLSVYTVVIWFGFLVLFGGLVIKVVKSAAGFLRPFANMLEDWRGEPSRPGFNERPGTMARIQKIEEAVAEIQKNVKPNGGSSSHDAIMARLESLDSKISKMTTTAPLHIEGHLEATLPSPEHHAEHRTEHEI